MFTYQSISAFDFEEVEKLHQQLATLEWEYLFARLEIYQLQEKIKKFLPCEIAVLQESNKTIKQ